MHQCHPDDERYDADRHDFVLSKQSLGADVASAQSHEYDGQGESGAPPTDQKSRVVFYLGCRGWGLGRVELANDEIHDVKVKRGTLNRLRRGVSVLLKSRDVDQDIRISTKDERECSRHSCRAPGFW